MIINGSDFVCCVSFLEDILLCSAKCLARKANFARERYDLNRRLKSFV